MEKVGIQVIFVLLIVFLLNSCNNKAIYSELKESESGIWNIEETYNFEVLVDKTKSFYDIFIVVDINKDFLTNNLWVFIETVSPSGNMLTDSIMYFIADQKGKWFGNEKGNYVRYKLLYKNMIQFPENGIYTIKLRHGMREGDLPLIKNIGITVSESEVLQEK